MVQTFFSIVVVCLNPGTKLADTVKSILSQQYGNYEIIIKDGGSADGSLQALPKDSRIRIYCEKDTGIYDAMNQALPRMLGQYVLFLNCGDYFYDDQVLGKMAESITGKNAEDAADGTESGQIPEAGELTENRKTRLRIFYGNQYNELQKCVVYSAPKVNDFTCYRNVPCHQVCFYDTRLFAERGYDLQYKVRADYEHFLYCIYNKKAEAVYTETLIARYEGGGFSETKENRRRSAIEHRKITTYYMGSAKVLCFRMIMLLTLAPLRTKLAENEKYAEVYNRIKTAVYRCLRKGK